MDSPWWFGLIPALVAAYSGYLGYESQRSVFTLADAQTVAAQLKVYGIQSGDRFASLSDATADSFGIAKPLTGTLDRSKLSFAAVDKNGVHGMGYSITAKGLGKKDCLNLEPKFLFDSVTVNGTRIDGTSMTVPQIQDLCHSTFWPWADGNVVVLEGS
ncbi:hypothetical protein E2553_40045 [Paraburkholderia dipogonis]|uniref:Uncharacterized protein n=1 Tax=Paraburkholderia dipogonis TaxID=1211383 RepID=A0A4Y8MJJ2_9BURK|nr:hypothetical protein [Paraburkholderia dipogonis]TFE37611.1 hypothetical protein E2553_40045 [Paraburkholderia dipogonis]